MGEFEDCPNLLILLYIGKFIPDFIETRAPGTQFAPRMDAVRCRHSGRLKRGPGFVRLSLKKRPPIERQGRWWGTSGSRTPGIVE